MDLRITSDGAKKDIDDILDGLKRYNLARIESTENTPLGVFLENDRGEKLAGLTGETFGNWLCIKYLFVSEDMRGRGVGKKLMAAAEKEAVKRGCKFVFVDTFSFQAPDFYRKLGYQEVFVLRDYPYTGARYYFTKAL